MRLDAKAALILVLTFALGAVVGAFGAGSLAQRRQLLEKGGAPGGPLGAEGRDGRGGGPGEGRGRPAGFVDLMEGTLQPRDSAQRAALRPLLEATDRRNRAAVDGARASMRAAMDTLRAQAAPLLDRAQLARLDEFVARQPRDGRGPPGLGGREGRGRPGGRGPDGRGGPPPGAPRP